MAVRSLLYALGYRFRLHRRDLPGTPDICLPGRRVAVFVNGCFWHGHDCRKATMPSSNRAFWQQKIAENRERDARSERQLRADGWKVCTVWECELADPDRLSKKLVASIEGEDLGQGGAT